MRIERQHNLGLEEVRQRVEQVAEALAVKYNLRYHWDDDDLKFKGSGVNGRIAAAETTVDVVVKLGFALMLLEDTIKSYIEQEIDQHLG